MSVKITTVGSAISVVAAAAAPARPIEAPPPEIVLSAKGSVNDAESLR